ncbi:MAG: hypothetical protein JST23_06175 [Bacteroidetes bacterium]|nr:hypothetical protein [Bacteroidota bacterium]
MKQIIACVALLLIAGTSYSQQTPTSAPLTKQDYLKKSKSQETAAWCFMGAGVGLTTLGFATNRASHSENNSENTPRVAAVVAGLSSVTVGTILFAAARRNKNKAQAFSFKMENTQQVQKGSLVYQSYPALSFKIGL